MNRSETTRQKTTRLLISKTQMESTAWKWQGKRRREDDEEEELEYRKYSKTEIENEGIEDDIRCSLTPQCCALRPFPSYADYEQHYENSHRKKCIECSRILPTELLLDLHICELHDSFFNV